MGETIACYAGNHTHLSFTVFQASKCEESWIDLKDGASSFARSINLLDRSGSLTVFRTGVKDGSQVGSFVELVQWNKYTV